MRRSREWRHLCSELVSIACAAGDGFYRAMTGNLEEIGERSALLLADSPIRSSLKVLISCDTYCLRGVVKSCTFEQHLGFMVEVMLDPDSCWSPVWFTPKHLLQVFRPSRAKRFPLKQASGYRGKGSGKIFMACISRDRIDPRELDPCGHPNRLSAGGRASFADGRFPASDGDPSPDFA
jgi:hypothetical protein